MPPAGVVLRGGGGTGAAALRAAALYVQSERRCGALRTACSRLNLRRSSLDGRPQLRVGLPGAPRLQRSRVPR